MTSETIETNGYRSRVGSYVSGGPMPRNDAAEKASGSAVYTEDVTLPNTAYAACARSTMPHALINSINTEAARSADGVIAVYTAADVNPRLYGKGTRDQPILAQGKVRFVGERVAAVVAESRRQAEVAVELVEIEYEPLPTLSTYEEALAPDAPHIHEAPWTYEKSFSREEAGHNVMYHKANGSIDEFETAYNAATFRIDRIYSIQGVHQGYLETWSCLADYRSEDDVQIWLSSKTPYAARNVLSAFTGLGPDSFVINPVMLGGDFGGKGGPLESPLVIELSRLTGRPVKHALRYNEDLTTTNPRHPAKIRVRLACDEEGKFVALALDALANGGAYAGHSGAGSGPGGFTQVPTYWIPQVYTSITRVYTNTVPRGAMRAPGAPQGMFALESAIDELAAESGVDPVDLRRRNLLKSGDTDVVGRRWEEHRVGELLDAAMRSFEPKNPPPGWLYGRGIAIYGRQNAFHVSTSFRLVPMDDGCVCVETPFVEVGTGGQTALREMIADQIGYPSENVKMSHVSTESLPRESGSGGSKVTSGFSIAAEFAGKAWANRLRDDEPVVIDLDEDVDTRVGSYTVQIAQVAVDPETGELKVLEILTVQDVANIIHPLGHQMQLDGGAVMGFSYAVLEDLNESEGQIWSANLGEFKFASARDAPELRTVLLPGGIGVGGSNVKGVGESSTPPTAPAIANAIFAATGVRIRQMPLTAERIYEGLRKRS